MSHDTHTDEHVQPSNRAAPSDRPPGGGDSTDDTAADDAPTGGESAARPSRSAVVPVYGEVVESWVSMVEALLGNGFEEVVVCIDDPDPATLEALGDLRKRPAVVADVADERRGKGGALIEGLSLASGDVIGYVDADGAIPVTELDRVYAAVEEGGADLAVGSRTETVTGRAGQTITRRLLGTAYRRLARRVTDVPLRDFQCGAKAFTRECWADVVPDLREHGFAFDTELVGVADRRGFAVEEVAIVWDDPGNSNVIPAIDAPRMLGALGRIRRHLAGIRPRDDTLNVALVSSHPPNRGHLAEYGQQLANAYGSRDDVSLTVLSRTTEGAPDVVVREPYCLRRCWQRNSLAGAWAILREVRNGDYDVVQFNIHMTYFGTHNAYRLVGLALPPLLRLSGVTVVTTLHDMLEVVASEVADQQVGVIERVGARVATQLVLVSNATTVTSERYREIAVDRYRAPNVYHVPHGTFFRADGVGMSTEGPFRILVFGHLSPSKDIETVVAAFGRVRRAVPDAELWIAGGSHPGYPGYREELEADFGDLAGVTFTGYVEEDEMDDVWHAATLVVMPYRTCTGVSGVFQLAKSYGVPVVVSNVEGMRTATSDTGGVAEFVDPGDPDDMAKRMLALWNDPERLADLARQNAAAADEYTITETADRMVDIFAAHHDGQPEAVAEVLEP